MNHRTAPTLDDVARAAGVSRATASRVINGVVPVSRPATEAVLEAVAQLGYRPNVAARALVTRRVGAVVVLVPETEERIFSDPFFPRAYHGALEAFRHSGFHVLLSMAHPHDGVDPMLAFFLSDHTDGAIVISHHGQDFARAVATSSRPVVFVGNPGVPGLAYVDVDQLGAAATATRHLIERGARTIGTVTGPHPFPEMVREFHKIIGIEARQQVLDLTGRLPDAVIACVGGGSNAMGIFHRFIEDEGVRLIGVEAGGEGIESGRHAARFAVAEPGVLHGAMSYLMQDEDGQTLESHSVSAGLDYPSVGPEHSYLRDIGRAEYRYATDEATMEAFRLLCRTEGIIPALESAHALAGALEVGKELGPDALLLVNLSGRGDKDMHTAAAWFGLIEEAR